MMEGDRYITTQKDLEAHILSFHEKLYTRDDQVEENVTTREDCLQYVTTTVTPEHNEELLKPLTMEEVTATIKQLPVGKALGVDTIPAEFYHELWLDIDLDIFNFVAETINQAHIQEELNINKIALIP